jgi:hypothetical protein
MARTKQDCVDNPIRCRVTHSLTRVFTSSQSSFSSDSCSVLRRIWKNSKNLVLLLVFRKCLDCGLDRLRLAVDGLLLFETWPIIIFVFSLKHCSEIVIPTAWWEETWWVFEFGIRVRLSSSPFRPLVSWSRLPQKVLSVTPNQGLYTWDRQTEKHILYYSALVWGFGLGSSIRTPISVTGTGRGIS